MSRAITAVLAPEAVMARRREPVDSLDFFPTPPWAARALLVHVIPDAMGSAWEPACGEGHIVHALSEKFATVFASDVHDYGGRQATGSFVGQGPDVIHERFFDPVDWIITNPPFNLAVEFAERCLDRADEGFALLLRSSWMEGADRYDRLFRDAPPAIIAPFVERVPMVKGRWDPDASSATAYTWFVWRRALPLPGYQKRTSWNTGSPTVVWIPPGCRQRLEKPSDREKFTKPDAMPLFDGVQT